MPHIHTEPGQRDMTVSAYVLRREPGKWLCLLHFHRKLGKLMQVGGHIELDETPWQAVAHELEEESGYSVSELSLVLPANDRVELVNSIVHPVPFTMNTHNVGHGHYHSDLCYGFVAEDAPKSEVHEGESDDVRWLELNALKQLVESGEALADVAVMYEFLLSKVEDGERVGGAEFYL